MLDLLVKRQVVNVGTNWLSRPGTKSYDLDSSPVNFVSQLVNCDIRRSTHEDLSHFLLY